MLWQTDGIQMAQRLYADARLLLQLVRLVLFRNRLDGTLPSSWAGLTQASHVPNATSSLQWTCLLTALAHAVVHSGYGAKFAKRDITGVME